MTGSVGRVGTSSTVALLATTIGMPALLGGQEAPAAAEVRGPTLSRQSAVIAEEPGPDPRAIFASAIGVARSARAQELADAEAAYERRVSAFRSVSQALTPDARRRIEAGPLREARGVLDDSQRLSELSFDREVERAVEDYGGPALAVFSAANDAIAEVRTEYEIYAAVVDAAEAAFGSEVERLRSVQDVQDGGHRADAGLRAAYEARVVAGIEAARLARVYSPDELAEVTKSIRHAALVAIAEIETEILAELPRTSITKAFRTVLDAYAEPKLLAIEVSLEAIEKAHANSVEAAEREAREARARARSLQKDLRALLAVHEGAYRRAVQAADGALQDVIVRYYSKDSIDRESKFGSARLAAASAHRNAIEAARDERRQAVSREIPEAESFLTEAQARLYRTPSRRIYGGPRVEAQEVVQAFRSYKNSRAASDGEFGEEVTRAYLRARERVVADSLDAARESAQRRRMTKRGNVVARVVTAPGRSERVQALEEAIRAALRAAGDGGQ